MIDYTYKAKEFSNTAIIDYSYFEMLYDLLDYSITVKPETIIGLSIFAEAIVLHEELIPTNNMKLRTSSDYEDDFLQKFLDKKVLYYNRNEIFTPIPNSASAYIYDELESYESLGDIEGYFEKLDYLAECHGIPSIRGIYNAYFGSISYDFENLNHKICNTVSKEYLNYIDNKKSFYANRLKPYLGNKYINLPSIISIILDRSKDIEDIPNQILYLRDEMKRFRDYTTKLHYDLRVSDNLLHSCEILDEIQCAEKTLDFDGRVKKKFRISQITPYLQRDLISSGINVTEKLEELIESNKLKLKKVGYYDLYHKAFDVKYNLKTLERLFGKAIDDNFVNRLNNLLLSQ